MKRASIICASLLWGLSAVASGDGSTAYNFLNISTSSHIYGLGGVNISLIDDDINVTDQNPALLGPEVEKQLGINYMRYIGESNFAGVKYGMAAGERSAWAVSVQYFDYGKMTSADVSGNITGTFSVKDICFGGTYSHDITDRLRGGISIKGIYSAYDEYSAFAVASDLGLNYFDPEKDLSLSFVVANLGGQVKRFNESYDRLPVDLRLGFTKMLANVPLRLSVTAWNLTRWNLPYYEIGDGSAGTEEKKKDSFGSNLMRHLVFAAEFVPSDKFYVGVGYNYKTRTDMSTYSRSFLSGFSLSAGLNVRRFGLGVAFAQPHSGATTLMFSITTRLAEF
ncbi:type IX secretion system protein PorQ [uncultured Muribaculum sp.]|uniref:type IX secretion system protein PorQ n=1 Tax=uncultured Muribaculum sp. TaxID=1918613 RepID=UPI0025B74E35|nr:type IX secretion system protein PorQ [uncultured Muribaculum sp.]